MVKIISKTNLSHIIITLGLIGNNILRVKAQQNDCAIYQEAVRYLGEDNINFSSTGNCCTLRDVITCENNSITKIKLNKIKCGKIEQSNIECVIKKLGSLPNLTSLEISNGDWCGSKMPKNMSELKKLKYLKMTHNGYDSELPESISTMINLEELDLSENRLIGTIPNSYGNLKNLKILKLNNNNIEGYIPYSFNNLENLNELNLGSTNLKGYIPEFPNIESCDYRWTGLCILSSTDCTTNIDKLCSKGDVKETNRSNGNPDPNSTEYEGDIRYIKLFFENHPILQGISYVLMFIVGVISLPFLIIFCVTGCCNIKDKYEEYKEKQDENKKNKNKNKSKKEESNLSLYDTPVNKPVQEEEVEIIVNKKQKRPHKDRIITKVRK